MSLTKAANYAVVAILTLGTGAALAAGKTWQALLLDGQNELNQQRLVPAEQSFRQALKAAERTSHSEEAKVTCLEKLASTLALEDKTDEAVLLYRRSLHILERRYGRESPKVVSTLLALGSIFESEGNPTLAMGLYKRALSINEKNYGPFSPAVANNLHRLGRVSYNAGRPEEAEHNYKASLSILMQQPGLASSIELESLLSDYSDLLKRKDTSDQDLVSDFQTEILKSHPGPKNFNKGLPPSSWQQEITSQSANSLKAQTNEEQKVRLRGFKEPFSSATLAPAYNTMADVLFKQHQYKDEEERYQRMIAIDIKALGPSHPTVADDLNGLALLYISQCRYAEAKPLLIRALAIYESVYGNDNLLVASTRATLAATCNNLGNTNQAAILYGKTLTQDQLALEPNELETAQMLNQLGYLYYSQGKLEDACTIYKWALASTEKATGKDNKWVAACLTDYAAVLRGLGRIAEADTMQARAMLISAKVSAAK